MDHKRLLVALKFHLIEDVCTSIDVFNTLELISLHKKTGRS